MELPPRARRIPPQAYAPQTPTGTTSACAENTFYVLVGNQHFWNYLRVRGEYMRSALLSLTSPELPPRARRILFRALATGATFGTTSACAENTSTCGMTFFPTRNYLRVRGEYAGLIWTSSEPAELPPRARRILTSKFHYANIAGTTSACAENTFVELVLDGTIRNYLRVRGEYDNMFDTTEIVPELPPRARRIPEHVLLRHAIMGTTSACAENTVEDRIVCPRTWNYLRVRGEYGLSGLLSTSEWELPPRARRIP